MFLEVRFKKMCDFVNLLLKFNIYVFSSRFKEFRYSINDISSFNYYLSLCMEVLLWKWIIPIHLNRYKKIYFMHRRLTRSQFLKGLKCESQIGNNRRTRSRGTLFDSQHFGGVEGRARAPGWDWEELTSFNYSHGLAQNQHKMVSA